MALLVHVEFDASSESTATTMLELLAGMGNIVQRDYSEVYTYLFRHANETKTKLIFTEIYGNEQVFLQHASDPEFTKLYQQAFNATTGKSRKELCIRNDINQPLLPITASILDNYLHVTYVPLEQGFFHRSSPDKGGEQLLIVCTGCDKNVYEQLISFVSCVTCVTFEESDGNRQLIAVVAQILNEKKTITDEKPSIDSIEIVCAHQETIEKCQDMMTNCFHIQSLHIQTSFSRYIHHKSS